MRHPRSFALLALAVCLSGCASSDGNAGSGLTDQETPELDPTVPAGLVAARFPGGATADRTIWANGTLRPEQANGVTGYGILPRVGPPAATVDVTSLAIPGMPMLLEATLDSTMTQGAARLRFAIPREDARNNAYGLPEAGKHHAESGIVRTGDSPIVLNLFYSGAEPAAEVPYTLGIRARTDPTVIRGAFPVGITVPNGTQEMVVELVGERRDWGFDPEVANLMLWSPDDSFLGHFALTQRQTAIPLAGGGEYVAILSQGGRSVRIFTEGTVPATLRALPQEFEVSDEHQGTPEQAEWTTIFARVPVLAGILVSPSAASPNLAMRLESQSGVLFDAVDEGPWFNVPQVPDGTLATSLAWDSAYGMPNLASGEYRATVQADMAVGADPIRGQTFVIFWLRS